MIELTTTDHLQIVQLQSIYAWAIDQREGDLFARVFTEDVEGDYPNLVQLQGLDHVRRWMDAFHSPFDTTHHHIANPWVEADGDEVLFRTYVTARLVANGTPGGDYIYGGGHYVDRVVRTDAGWRIRHRRVHNHWREGNLGVFDVGRRAAAAL